ncbi:SWIM zinc finger protein [Chitinophaga skermanii]|uniref:SWIM zinc finger protein n=1 Tax=Chitinophaga skermanii TaxID=331697 RepID=A0A327QQW1_9BACT|nr:SWIM zinc finger family protein [Chitinophaga skermanii]RAJ06631.1 SWIM zinc finger protein [Chitinophaga skermanii]
MNLTEEQVLALAPDESSKKSGKELANAAKWVSRGTYQQALWGECKGSGSKPYQTQIDTAQLSFKCSCPSRKFPCKHGLGLMILYTRDQTGFQQEVGPDWVQAWLGKRAETAEKKAAKVDKPVDEAAQAKRLHARHAKVTQGAEELMLWMKDILRNGILTVPEKPYTFWENMRKRMVDAQANGLANMVQQLENTPFYQEGWQTVFLQQMVDIYLLLQGYKNIEQLSPAFQSDVLARIGFTQSQDELKNMPGVEDDWLVLAKTCTEDGNITTERFWLRGVNTGQYAMVLNFIVRGQVNSMLLAPGAFIHAELVFYPSVLPLRAIVKSHTALHRELPIKGVQTWMDVAMAQTQAREQYPFSQEAAFVVEALTPLQFNNEWWLRDQNSNLMRIPSYFSAQWHLLALSGGLPLKMAVVGKEDTYLPLGVWHQDKYITV